MKLLRNLTLVGLGLGVCAGAASAQELRTASENVVACQSVVDALERLDCFEKAADELSAALTVPPLAQESIAAPSVPAAAPTQQAAAETALVAAATETAAAPVTPAAAPTPVQQAAATAAATTDAAEDATQRSVLPGWIPRVTFRNNRDVEKEPDQYETEITRIQVNRIGRHFFTMSDGLVWKMKDIEEIRAPSSLPADAIIRQNIMGGILLKIVDTNVTYAVERVE
ncbi:MAG: hypothetical protein AAFV59_12535 [Pseudomonadota bacterium]